MTSYNGWKLTEPGRAMLLALFPPKYPDVVAHHVTHQFGSDAPLAPATIFVLGRADDGCGLETLVVSVNGSVRRPADCGIYHITWSLDRAAGRTPVQSNDVLAHRRYAWRQVGCPVVVPTEPFVA